jgi:hypothetical protein
MTKQLRIGMLGAGFIGSFHSYALSLQSLIRNPPCAAIWLAVLAVLAVLADLNEVVRTVVQKSAEALRVGANDVLLGGAGRRSHHRRVCERRDQKYCTTDL